MRMFRLIVLAALGGGVWFIGTHSVILTREGVVVAKKPAFSLEDVYVDVREWEVSDYIANSDITRMLLSEGYQELKERLQEAGEDVREQLDDLLESIR